MASKTAQSPGYPKLFKEVYKTAQASQGEGGIEKEAISVNQVKETRKSIL